MRKYIFSLTIIIVIFTGFFISHNMKDSKLTSREYISYNTKEQAIDNKSDENFVGFEPIYEYELEPYQYIVVYYNDSEDFLCAAVIEEIGNYFYWERLTPYFSFENIAILNNQGAYVICPVVINDTELEICMGIIVGETKIKSDDDVHIINNKFFVIIKEGKINVELL